MTYRLVVVVMLAALFVLAAWQIYLDVRDGDYSRFSQPDPPRLRVGVGASHRLAARQPSLYDQERETR